MSDPPPIRPSSSVSQHRPARMNQLGSRSCRCVLLAEESEWADRTWGYSFFITAYRQLRQSMCRLGERFLLPAFDLFVWKWRVVHFLRGDVN